MQSLSSRRTLYLVRHGAIAAAGRRTFLGQKDVPLSDEGIRQAERLHCLLDRIHISGVCASDLVRCRRTAEIITVGRGFEIRVRHELSEINMGDWDGLSFAEISRRFPKEFADRGADLEHWRPPRGESFGDCHERVLPALRQALEAAAGNLLVVAHAGVNRLILADALGLPIPMIFHIAQDYGCLNVIEYGSTGTRVALLNYTPGDALPLAPAAVQALAEFPVLAI